MLKSNLGGSLILFWKDLQIELRSKELFRTLLVFCLLLVVVFNLSWEMTRETVPRLLPGILWVLFVFADILLLSRTASMDREENRIEGILLAPVGGSTIFIGKFFSNLFFLLLVELLILPLLVIFFELHLRAENAWVFLPIFLGSVGFSAAGVLLSSISVRTRLRELFLPLLLFPVAAPILVACVESTQAVFAGTGEGFPHFVFWMQFLTGYDLIFLILGFLLYESAISE